MAVSALPHEKSHEYFRRAVDAFTAGGRREKEIAIEAGFNKPNNISNFKTGATRIPVDRVCDLARALDGHLDPHALLAKVLSEHYEESGLTAIADFVIEHGVETRFKPVLAIAAAAEDECLGALPVTLSDAQQAVLRSAFLEVLRLERTY